MKFKIISLFLGLCAALPLFAQTPPSAEQMIEQLKAPPRTRSLRNLTVEASPAPATTGDAAPQQAPPSLSLLIQFDFNSAHVRPESQQALSNLSQALQSAALRNSKFAIEGHTDAKGSAAYNLKLSAQRAQAVSDFLKVKGVDEARLLASGKGSASLANSEQPFAAENRRVRIVNLD
jgi:outer membrane protein OmpA-like peptidoglycan-associated protein